MQYLNQDAWFHGTTLSAWKSLCSDHVQAMYNRGTELDFGIGFYLTPKRKQAETYITRMLPYVELDCEEDRIPIVIEFELNFSKLSDAYKKAFFLHYDDEFANFVFENRMSPYKNIHDFDYILGVMSDSNPNHLMAEYRSSILTKEEVLHHLKKWTSVVQASLHHQEICDILRVRSATEIITGKELEVNDYNAGRTVDA